jgi:F-type H+-transporting ATPase subunit b
MLIDWFTVVAQAINFLILVWLLKRFLYKPILDAIDAREQLIAETITEAVETKNAAQTQRDELERKNQQFSHDRDALISQMKQAVNAQRHKLLDEAQQTAEAIRAKRLEALQREQKAFADEIARQTQEQIFSISRKVLRQLADASLEEQITTVFTRQLHDMSGQAKQALAEALTKSSEPVRVRSAFELSDELQTTIQDVISETFAADVLVRFEVEPEGIGGIELTANGRKVSWSIDGYLTLLQKSLMELTGPEAEALEQKTELVSESVS